MFFFGPPRFLLVFVALFFLLPIFLYSPGFALVIGGIVLLALVAGGGARRRRERALDTGYADQLRPARPFAEVKAAAQDDLLALGGDIRALDLDIEMPGANPAAREPYARALDLYEQARRAFDRARAPEDFEAVSAAVEEGRFEMATAQALLEGRPPPERRPPCFFDPRHGPSVRDVEWAPPGGTPRPVPACAADAIRIEEGGMPETREVLVGGRPVPYWNAPAYYGPWAGGFFGSFGGLVPGLLLGSALGAGLSGFGPFGIDEADAADLGFDEIGGGDFGDGGGGDFGGGDFGGGDF